MAKPNMLGQMKPYTPNNKAYTPGRKRPVVIIQGLSRPSTKEIQDLIKKHFDAKEK